MKTLESDRFLIRPFRDSDFAELKDMMTDDEVMKFTGYKQAQPDVVILSLLKKWRTEISGEFGVWCAEAKANQQFCGWFMLKITDHGCPEIGFMIPRKLWGKGITTEVAKELIRYAFNDVGIQKIIASTSSSNLASIRVLEKIGMMPSSFTSKDSDIKYFEILASN